MSRRGKAREAVFQILYQDDLNPSEDQVRNPKGSANVRAPCAEDATQDAKTSPTEGDDLLARRLRGDELLEFASSLLAGVRRNRQELDARLDATAEHWSVRRMAPTDRNALRIGAYEILFTDTPDTVAVNEAIELAKRYGTAQSAGFVNGILDQLMHGRCEDASTGDEKTAAEPDKVSEKPAPESLPERARRLKARK